MLIGIDIRHLTRRSPSGVGQYTISLINALKDLDTDHRFLLFASGKSRSLEYIPDFSSHNITIQKFQTSNRLLTLKMLKGLITLDDLSAQNVDKWFFPNINIFRTKKPYYITAHDISFHLMPEHFSRKQKLWHYLCQPQKTYNQAEGIISVSKATTSDLCHHFKQSSQKIHTIPLAVHNDFSPRIKPNDKNILQKYNLPTDYILNISTLEPRKNHLGLIQAYELARDTSNTFKSHLVLAGGLGYKGKQVLEAIKKSRYRQDIHYLGYIDNDHRPSLYRLAKMTTFPSFYEGFGLPIIESLACGTPVIAGANSSMLEIVDRKYGLCVNPFHVDEIAQAMQELQNYNKGFSFNYSQSWSDVATNTLKAIIS